MQKYALVDNKLYTVVAEPMDCTNLYSTAACPNTTWNELYSEPNTSMDGNYAIRTPFQNPFDKPWNETYTPSLVVSNISVNDLSTDGNSRRVDMLVDAIRDLKLTEQFAINSAVRVEVRYCILDSNQQVVDEETAKIRVGKLEDFLQPNPMDETNTMEYNIGQCINARIELAAPFHELGISKGSRGSTRTVRILNIRAYISTTNENVYSQLLTEAQTKIGWTINSPTQEEIRSRDILIYDMLDDPKATNQLPHDITIRDRKDRVALNFNLFTNLFVYTYSTELVDNLLHLNQRMLSKYSVITTASGRASVNDALIQNIAYGETITVRIAADDGWRVSSLDIKGKFNQYNDIVLDRDMYPNGITLDLNVQIDWNETDVIVVFPCVDDNYTIDITTEINQAIPPEDEKDPEEPGDDVITPPAGDDPATPGDTTGTPEDGDDPSVNPDDPTSGGDGESNTGDAPTDDTTVSGGAGDAPESGDSSTDNTADPSDPTTGDTGITDTPVDGDSTTPEDTTDTENSEPTP